MIEAKRYAPEVSQPLSPDAQADAHRTLHGLEERPKGCNPGAAALAQTIEMAPERETSQNHVEAIMTKYFPEFSAS